MIFATGDTHGDWMSRLNTSAFPEQKEMTKDDYVIILGDFGYWHDSPAERHNLDWLEKKPFTTLFIPGNHDNYDRLDVLPEEEWNGGRVSFIRPSVICLKRGQVFRLQGSTFFAFGGASSHDISDGILEPDDPLFKEKKRLLDKNPCSMYRINHISWWERELPSQEEMDEGFTNLREHGNAVDFILTHSPFASAIPQTMPYAGTTGYRRDSVTEYLQGIRETVDYKKWLFGHMHVNKNLNHEKACCIYEQIIRLA